MSRVSEVTAISLSRLVPRCVDTDAGVPAESCASPETRAAVAGPPPLYGTSVMRVPLIEPSSATARWEKLPLPAVE